ncbi:MAG: hypothetical protein A3I31_01860 [Candidatus Colwellbacteria bacterium RIFCSPLOWO2_02_FULL_44_20b]|uniref:Uncharacterized protein n=1 Tax=Candidatus Colwellbacteria bacterium RIFCSPLOWO2_02_FULL_44_20b TaxID=1797691 RepID=A0A1G1Z4L6_9BACT|nr:MAG: hypothetical protein A3I31_01860 [Candidatus Colwellbacteria bacterium RIFCSPLOWO2_02_FULL_44_20b]
MRVFYPILERFEPRGLLVFNILDFLLQRLLAQEKLRLLQAVDFPLNILVKIDVKKTLEFLSDSGKLGFQLPNKRCCIYGSLACIFVSHFQEFVSPLVRQGIRFEKVGYLPIQDFSSHGRLGTLDSFVLPRTAIVNVFVDIAIFLPLYLMLRGYHHPARPAPDRSAQCLRFILGFIDGASSSFQNRLHFIE